jgi:DNA polymerase I-like protein with 3'-5' exonuclease and polymerase domains
MDYDQLAQWSIHRDGQVMVCENEGAKWLPFRFLTKRAGSFSGRDEQTAASGGEVIWESGIDPVIDPVVKPNALAFAFRQAEIDKIGKDVVDNDTVKILTHQPETVPSVERPNIVKTSALDFAFAQRSPDAVSGAFETSIASVVQTAPAAKSEDGAKLLRDALLSRGHRLLTKDGKLFVSNASLLTPADREAIKAHREQLIRLAEEWHEAERLPAETQTHEVSGNVSAVARVGRTQDEDTSTSALPVVPSVDAMGAASLFDEAPRPAVSLAQFLGSEPPRVDSRYVADEPPNLTNVKEVVLNFAADGTDWRRGHLPGGLTVSTLDGQLCRFLPFRFQGGNLDEAQIKRWAQEQLRNKKITNARTKFDIHMSRCWGVDLEAQGCTFSDIQHTAALLDDHRKRFGLDVLAKDYFPNEPFVGRVDESRHLEHHPSEVVEREKFTARLVGRLRDVMYPEIDKQELRAVHDLEDGVIPPVVEMEKQGSPIDEEFLERTAKECCAEYDALMWDVSHEIGHAFEHTPKGWTRMLEGLGLPVPDSFAESELSQIDHPLVRKGQRAVQYFSLNSKIYKPYPEHIINGVLQYDINQLASDEGGTVSGRFSIGLVQQVPNHDNHHASFGDWGFPKHLFIPGSGDYLEADAAQIEFRLLVHYSQNAKLLQAYKDDPRMSFHKQMQAMLIAYKPDMNYAHTKSYNFAAQYGARSIKLAVMMGFITAREGDEIRKAKRWDDPRLKTIKEIEAAYKRAHPEAGELLDRAAHLAKPACDDFCKKGDALHRQYPHRGYVKTLLGRRSRFPTNYKTYIGLNRVLQGTGASIMKRKLIELHDARAETGFVMRITNHDAVLGDATTPETLSKVSAILNHQSFDLKVPILWECGVGRNWGSVVKA